MDSGYFPKMPFVIDQCWLRLYPYRVLEYVDGSCEFEGEPVI
ncbi:hypothetical protein B194_2053 [Serratia plymuthica A30]|nr:hypothetical protein B194_2053 [Serratia plymuthica A30]